MTQPAVRACPTCRTPVDVAALGHRDYSRWLENVLPGKVSGSDLDFVLDQASTGRMLVIEFKEQNKRLGAGQRILFQQLVKKGIEVWVAWEYDAKVRVGVFDATGQVRFLEELNDAAFAAKVRGWWYDGLQP